MSAASTNQRIRIVPWVALLVAMLAMLSLPPSAEAASYQTPTGIKTTNRTANTLALAWNTSPNAPRYRVRYATTANLSDSTYHRTYNPNYQLTGLKPNTTYYIQVRVISADGTTNLTPYSPTFTTTTASSSSPTTAPTPPTEVKPTTPTGVKLVGSARTALAVEWTSVKGATKYRVSYRQIGRASCRERV